MSEIRNKWRLMEKEGSDSSYKADMRHQAHLKYLHKPYSSTLYNFSILFVNAVALYAASAPPPHRRPASCFTSLAITSPEPLITRVSWRIYLLLLGAVISDLNDSIQGS